MCDQDHFEDDRQKFEALGMVTRRQFGYWLRDKIAELDPTIRVDLGFCEGLLESWAAREALVAELRGFRHETAVAAMLSP